MRLLAKLMLVVLLPAMLWPIAGCHREAVVTKPEVPAGKASVSGIVKFDGSPPAKKFVADASFPQLAKPLAEEMVVVNADGTMRNVVVYLENGPNVRTEAPPVLLDQKNCHYEPHVLALRTGQPLTVRSSDPTMHNVHVWKPEKNSAVNLSFAIAGQEQTLTFNQPEILALRCDIHAWMNAYVAVFDHPFFAVTGDEGRFELKDIPAGTYTLVAWQERYGERRQKITVTDAAISPVEFRFGK